MPENQIIATVFGSSRPSDGDADYAEARELGWALAEKGFTVCTGGYGGVMEAASRGAKDAGGRTLGVTAKFFGRSPNRWVDEVIEVDTWQQRLFALIEQGNIDRLINSLFTRLGRRGLDYRMPHPFQGRSHR